MRFDGWIFFLTFTLEITTNKFNPSPIKSHSTVTDLEDTTNFPYLTFIYRYKSHEFGFVKELTDNSHLKLHNTISKLKHQGLGYRKISKKLNEMGIKSVTGKTFYPSLVSNMWRTIKRREEKLNREVISEYTDFDIVFVERY